MMKDLAWNAFKKTGDINTFLELKQIENLENNLQINQKNGEVNTNEHHKNEGNSNC